MKIFLFNLVVLLIIAFVIGKQRAKCGKDIGFRSLSILMLGVYAFTYLSCGPEGILDYHVIAQVVTGISFVGAGLIFRDKGIHNLTTAILIWSMASVAMLLGLSKTIEAIIISTIIGIILTFKKENNE